MRKPIIVPGIIANSQDELDMMLESIKGGAKRVMLDFMDGKFVENRSIDFDFKVPAGLIYEAHLMVNSPLNWIEKHHSKVDIAILHVESLQDIGDAIDFAKDEGLKVFLAQNPKTDVNVVTPFMDRVDGLLILTVEPGQYGAPFVPETLGKIRALRKISHEILIEVDGAMNPENAKKAIEAGANIIASGSYILKSSDPHKSIEALKKAAFN